jgi:hypothetical protein
MPTSYSKFKLEDIKALGINAQSGDMFEGTIIPEKEPSALLLAILERNQQSRMGTEKAKSEKIIAPILEELEAINKNHLAIFSGYQFNIDRALGLTGFCDFIFSKNPKSLDIQSPIFCVAESKNENLDNGIAQCIAEMYAAQIFNQKNNTQLPIIYGTVTFGLQWKFLQLIDKEVIVDKKIYYITELPKLLGVLNYIVNQ